MRETKRFIVTLKKFKKSDIQNIWNVFLDEHKRLSKGNTNIYMTIHCIDDTSYDCQDLSPFENGNFIDTKKIYKIQMEFRYYGDTDNHISFDLSHSGSKHDNLLIVQGKETNWVNGVFNRIVTLINSVEPQSDVLLRHKTIVLNLIALGIGITGNFIIYLILEGTIIVGLWDPHNISPDSSLYRNLKTASIFFPNSYVTHWLWRWFSGFCWGAFPLREWLLELWPSIEFDFGPDHLKIEKIRRSRIYIFLSIAVLPLLVNILYDIAKKVWIK